MKLADLELVMSLLLGLRFCTSRKGGTGGSVWVHPKGATSVAASGRDYRKALVGTGWAISLVCMNRLRKQTCGFVGPPFLTMMHFSGFFVFSTQSIKIVGWSGRETTN